MATLASASPSPSPSPSTSPLSYKQLKEDFVSNLTGSSSLDVALILAGGHVAALLWSSLQARQSFFKPYTPLALVVDFLVNVAVLLLSVTLYSGNPLFLHLLLLGAAVVIYALPPSLGAPRRKPLKPKLSSTSPAKPATPPPSSSSPSSPSSTAATTATTATATATTLSVLSIKPFLTIYRANMIIMTCICILAVDFPLFPRRFAKVETWGVSLMDIGVGSFVYSAGVVASRPVLKERAAGGRPTPLATRLWRSLRHSLPLLVLGLVRLLSVKGLDYAEHVTEYGVHWNFFFTLGFLPPFVALFQSALRIIPSYAGLAILTAVLYQVFIESTPLKAYILTAPRTDLISMNREGIFSFIGYLAIFLAGQDTGMFVLPRRINPRSNSGAGVQRRTLVLTLGAWALVWSGLYLWCTGVKYGAGLDISRRMANLPYVLWVAAANTWILFGFCLIETVFFPAFYCAQDARSERDAYKAATSRVMDAFNRNGLAIFLVANLLTGLVNMTVLTLHVSQMTTVAILLGYMTTLTAVAVGLDMRGISIKL